MSSVNIRGLDKADVLAALYNNAKQQGLGRLNPQGQMLMTAKEVSPHLGRYIEYLNGRVLKVDLSGDEFDPYLYDRDNGQGRAARVIDNLRRTGSVGKI